MVCGLSWFSTTGEEILAVYEGAVPTNTEKTSKLDWLCLQIQFWLNLFLYFYKLNFIFFTTYNNLHKVTHMLLFRDERN